MRSPLTEPGVEVEEGDYIIAVDNVPASSVKNFYQLLRTADQVVTLRVSDAADGGNARDVRVKTIASEQSLRYRDWVDSRRRLVDQLSDGRIGYIHVPNTAVDGNRELFRGMLAYGHKEALIIDDRYNGGGFISGPDDRTAVAAAAELLEASRPRPERDPAAAPPRAEGDADQRPVELRR